MHPSGLASPIPAPAAGLAERVEPQRSVSLCADDYGLAPGVSAAIRSLAAQGRLSATSCMTVYPDWPEQARSLLPLADTLEIGLHLVLTDARPLAPMPTTAPRGCLPSLGRLLVGAQAGRLSRVEIGAEIHHQLDAFEAALGRPPDFVDGHRHIHVLPGVRDALLRLFAEGRLARNRTWVRACIAPWSVLLRCREAVPHALLIDRLSRSLAVLAQRRGIRTNRRFLGVNRFRPEGVAQRFGRWLDHVAPGTLIMCHPGQVDRPLRVRDAVHAAREAELAYLAGPDFAAALAQRSLRLGPLGIVKSPEEYETQRTQRSPRVPPEFI